MLKHDLAARDVSDVTEANNVLNRSQQLEFPYGKRRDLCHRRNNIGVESQHCTDVLQTQEKFVS